MGVENLKEIEVWGERGTTPNPRKVFHVLEELGIPYKIHSIGFDKLKQPEYESINPNGRIPAIRDPNRNDFILWESGAILEYIVETYDTEHKISFPQGSDDYYVAKQWLAFQISGQGPYYGQATWFTKFHPEQLPSAKSRYYKEIARVHGVLERHLAKQKEKSSEGPWLVGDKFSYVDLAFYPWQKTARILPETEEFNPDDYPLAKDWFERVGARSATKAAYA